MTINKPLSLKVSVDVEKLGKKSGGLFVLVLFSCKCHLSMI